MINYLDSKEPKLVRLLTTFWKLQQNEISYKEIAQAFVMGSIAEKIVNQWRMNYSQLVITHFQPLLAQTISQAMTNTQQGFRRNWIEDWIGAKNWIDTKGVELVRDMTTTQTEALKTIIGSTISQDKAMHPDQLQYLIRPVIGLTNRQSQSVMTYYESLVKQNYPKEKALNLSIRYAQGKHRQRANTIARTELANAYNTGAEYSVREGQKQNLIGNLVKEWLTALDERVCPICGEMEGIRVGLNDLFILPDGRMINIPSLSHPNCRCLCGFNEV